MKDTGRERENFFSTKKNKKSPYTTQYIVTYIRCFFLIFIIIVNRMKECVIQEQKMNIFQKTKPFLFCAFEPISKKSSPIVYI